MKRKITLILVVVMMLVCSMNVSLYAASGDYEVYRWDNIVSVLDVISFDGTAGNYSAMISGASGVDKITATVTLYYKSPNNGKWLEMPRDWTYSVDDDRLIIDEDFTALSGREYKVELKATVYKDGYGEPVSKTSTKTCP